MIAARIHLDADARRRQVKRLAERCGQLPVFGRPLRKKVSKKAPSRTLWIGGKTVGGEHRRDHAVARAMTGVKRLGHRAAMRADAAGFGRCNAKGELRVCTIQA